MTESLADEYPEAAPYIERAVVDHGEAWVLDHYYERLYPLGRVIEMPEERAPLPRVAPRSRPFGAERRRTP